jgi:hypothetical protein
MAGRLQLIQIKVKHLHFHLLRCRKHFHFHDFERHLLVACTISLCNHKYWVLGKQTELRRSVKLLQAFVSTVIPGFSLIEIQDQDFCSLLDMYGFRSGALFRWGEGSIFLRRRYVCCTVVWARVYPRCHGIQVTLDSVHPLSLHYTK